MLSAAGEAWDLDGGIGQREAVVSPTLMNTVGGGTWLMRCAAEVGRKSCSKAALGVRVRRHYRHSIHHVSTDVPVNRLK